MNAVAGSMIQPNHSRSSKRDIAAPIKGARLKKIPVLNEPNLSRAFIKKTRLTP
jgi:hypothetical protein